MAEILAGAAFSLLSDDIVINIFLKVESDPRDWARLASVCTRFSDLVRNVCYRAKVTRSIPSVVSDLLFPLRSSPADADGNAPPGGWASLHKLSVCCPGLLRSGILLENSDLGLERDIGPDQNHLCLRSAASPSSPPPFSSATSSSSSSFSMSSSVAAPPAPAPPPDVTWSLFDDLYFDTVYDASESPAAGAPDPEAGESDTVEPAAKLGRHVMRKRKRQWEGPVGAHLAAGGAWSLSREQGNKLLASRFRGDSLYICDWPGCVHGEGKRKYMLFRGVLQRLAVHRRRQEEQDGPLLRLLLLPGHLGPPLRLLPPAGLRLPRRRRAGSEGLRVRERARLRSVDGAAALQLTREKRLHLATCDRRQVPARSRDPLWDIFYKEISAPAQLSRR